MGGAAGGESVYKVAAQKLASSPPLDPRDVSPGLPAAIAEVILRCMAKERDARFADADAVARALSAALEGASRAPQAMAATASPPRSAPQRKNVAVLPLRCEDPEDLHIGSALADDMVDMLSGSPDLRARARGGSDREGTRDRDPCAVGRALGVDVVVEGTVGRVEIGIRVTLRVLSVADGFQLWARRYEVPLSRAFSIGDEAAAAVCEAVTLEFHRAPRVHSSDSGAIDLYMRARHAFQSISLESLERALLGQWEAQDALQDETPAPGSINLYWLFRWRMLMWRRDAEGARLALPVVQQASLEFRASALGMLSYIAGASGPEAALADVKARSHGVKAVRRRVLMHQLTAEVFAFRGDREQTLAALELADVTLLLDLLWLDACPLFAPYRGEPRFAAVRSSVAERASAISAELGTKT